MVRYVICFCLVFLFSIPSHAAINPNPVPQLTLGATASLPSGAAVIFPSKLAGTGNTFGIQCYTNGGTAGRYAPCWKGGVKWQVSSGVSAYCFGISALSNASNRGWQFVSSTAAITYEDSALTGGLYQNGSSAAYTWTHTTAYTPTPIGVPYTFGASTHPGIQYNGTNEIVVTMSCFEQ